MKIAAWLLVLAGVWLVVAPFVLKYSETRSAMMNDIITGAIVVVLGLATALGGRREQPMSRP